MPVTSSPSLEDSHLRTRLVKSKDAAKPRAGWEEAAREMRDRGEDGLLDSGFATEFDESEWVWESPIQGTTDSPA